jgi:hypothetical protein
MLELLVAHVFLTAFRLIRADTVYRRSQDLAAGTARPRSFLPGRGTLTFFFETFFFETFFFETFFFATFFFETFFFEVFFLAAFFLATFFLETFFFATFFLATFFFAVFFLVARFFVTAFFLVTLRLLAAFLRAGFFFAVTFLRVALAFWRFLLAAFFAGIFDSCRIEKRRGLYMASSRMEAHFLADFRGDSGRTSGGGQPVPPRTLWYWAQSIACD